MKPEEKNCLECGRWTGEECELGFETEPAWFRFCWMTGGRLPVQNCPGPFPAGQDKKKAAPA